MSERMVEVQINCPSVEVANAIAAAAVEQRLAACSNRFAAIRSSYWWEGSIEEADEVQVVLKSPESNFAAIEALVCSLHPYDVPSILGIVIDHVNAEYLQWVFDSTTPQAT